MVLRRIHTYLILFLCSPMILGASGCPNAFSEFAVKTSDEALLFNANEFANTRDWTKAIAAINLMTPTGRAKRETRATLASYYAGRCGLDLLSISSDITGGIASTKLWPLLLSSYKGNTPTHLADCQLAETELRAISTSASGRSADENVLMAFIEFTKMGTVLAAASGVDSDNDGTSDALFDACSTSDISDVQIQELGTGITNAILSLSASGSSVAGGVVSSVTAMCTAVDTLLSTTGFCDKTATTDFGAAEILVIRALIKSNEIGFNSCNGSVGTNAGGTASDCICPVIP